MNENEEFLYKIHMCNTIDRYKQWYKDLAIPDVNTNMSIQELESIYEQAKADMNEYRMVKQKEAKQAFKEDLIKKILEPTTDDKDVRCKMLVNSLNEYMSKNGISTEIMKRDFIDLFVELATEILNFKFKGTPITCGQIGKPFCDKYNLKPDPIELVAIIESIPILMYK